MPSVVMGSAETTAVLLFYGAALAAAAIARAAYRAIRERDGALAREALAAAAILTLVAVSMFHDRVDVDGEAKAGSNIVFIVPCEALSGDKHGFLNSPLPPAPLERAKSNAGKMPEISRLDVEELLKSVNAANPPPKQPHESK